MASSSHDRGESERDVRQACALLFDSSGRRIAVTNGNSPTLPRFAIPDRFYPDVEHLVAEVSRVLGRSASVLRCLDSGDPETGRPRLYSMFSTDADSRLAPGFDWLHATETHRVAGLAHRHIAALRVELDRVAAVQPRDPAVPWEWPGPWYDAARQWVEHHQARCAQSAHWSFNAVRSWSISTVYRVSRNAQCSPGRFYFKAVPTFFANEVGLTADVAKRFPDISPRIRDTEKTLGWMLMEDMGDRTLNDIDDLRLWADAMRSLARIQISYAAGTESLARMGLEHRDTDMVRATLARWIEDPRQLELLDAGGPTEDALGRLRPLTDLVDRLCSQLDSLNLPPTLDHGDLDGGNIFVRDGTPVLMDWSDASISSPLFTPALIPQVARNPQLVDAFLAQWTAFAPIDRLRQAFEAARPIAALERAFHYQRNIVPYLARPSVDLHTLEMYIPDLLDQAASSLEELG